MKNSLSYWDFKWHQVIEAVSLSRAEIINRLTVIRTAKSLLNYHF